LQKEPRVQQRIKLHRAGELAAIFLALLVFAVYARTLDKQSLWFDEGLSVIFAARSLPELLRTLIYEDLHPPLYYLLLHFWMLLAGNSEWAVRMPSALAAVLLVPLTFAVVREVSGERKGTSWPWAAAGVTAAALVGTSPFIAFYAQETRMYSIAAALSLATTWAFLKATRTATLRWWCIFSYFLATSLYTQYFSAFIVPAFWLYALLFDRRALRRTMLSTALAGLLYLPWLRPAYLQIGRLLRTPDYWVTTRVDLGFFVRAMWNTFLPNASTRLGLLLALLGAILLIHFARQRRFQLSERVRRSTLVFLTFLIPLVLTYAVITLVPKFVTRYAIVVAAPLHICAVLALYPLLSHKAVWMRALFGLLVIAAVVMSLRSTLAIVEGRENRRDDVRGLAAYLTQHVQANDALLLAENDLIK